MWTSFGSCRVLPWYLSWERLHLQSRDPGSIPRLQRSPGEGRGNPLCNPLQYSCLETPHGQRSLVGYSPWSCKELDMTERLSVESTMGSQQSCNNYNWVVKLLNIPVYKACPRSGRPGALQSVESQSRTGLSDSAAPTLCWSCLPALCEYEQSF